MQRLRISQTAAGGLVPIVVMRREQGDHQIMGGYAYDGHNTWMASYSIDTHRTPSRGYDTIVQFANGAVGMIRDEYVEQALRELGLREVTT